MEQNRKLILDKYNRPTICEDCGGAMSFVGVGEYVCEKCGYVAYDDYGLVRNYIEEHKGATTAEISAFTGVSQRTINDMLRDERFEITSDSKVFLKCKGCGKEIRSGLYCPVCEKLAEAAETRRILEKEKAERKKNIQGVGVDKIPTTADGAKRFHRNT